MKSRNRRSGKVIFFVKMALPMIGDKARALVEKHREAKDTLIIITATNRFVTEPIAGEFNIDNLIATEPEIKNGQFTGDVTGTPCFREGKVERLLDWIEVNKCNLDGSWFYSDSHNDLPLLKLVKHAVAVNPDQHLKSEADRLHLPTVHLY